MKHNKVWPKWYLWQKWIRSHLKLELSVSFCSTNWPLCLLNIYVWLMKHNKVWPKWYLWQTWIWSHLKLELVQQNDLCCFCWSFYSCKNRQNKRTFKHRVRIWKITICYFKETIIGNSLVKTCNKSFKDSLVKKTTIIPILSHNKKNWKDKKSEIKIFSKIWFIF